MLETVQHYHDNYEIYFLKEGRCNYFIDDRTYEVESGDLILIPEGIIHRTTYKENSRCRLLINFPRSLLSPSVSAALSSVDFLYRNPLLTEKIENIFLKIEEEYERDDEISDDALVCYTTELVLLVLRNQKDREVVIGGTSYIEAAVKYMQENYMHAVSLSALSALASVSPEHFSRTFKRETGFGVNEFLTLIRLQRAEYMLKNEPGKSVGEVAYACGFNDSNYFSYKFKKAYGYPPIQTRTKKAR
jgi:AraC-like DNA-binding protein